MPTDLWVFCPLCGECAKIMYPKVLAGYDLPPVWWDFAGLEVQVTEHVAPRIAGWYLSCECLVEHPPWRLRVHLPTHDTPPHFIKEE